ncbi:DUF222 domain-containing protein [Jannaschia sp. R86511]|uniref:DUF222 domain-containing protein n=1 Tax=Jannaschia sp. R86511 TaxID=3093853 RepID=UPI0036D36B0C
MFDEVSPAEVVAVLAETDCAEVSTRALVRVMADAAAVAAWAESTVLAAVAELRDRRQQEHQQLCDELGPHGRDSRAADAAEVDRFCAVEVATVLRLSQRAAGDRVALADDLCRRLPATMRELGAGRLGLAQARSIRDAVSVLDDPAVRAVEERVLPEAGSSTPGQLAARTRRVVDGLQPRAAAARCVEARERRRVETWGLDDGVAALRVTGPAETVAGAWARVDALARHAQDGARSALRALEAQEGVAAQGDEDSGVPTLDQLRADTVLRLLAGSHDLTEQPSPHVSVGVDVLVPLGSLAGADDAPAELSGHGPLPAAVARALAVGAASWRCVPTAPDGTVAVPCGADPPWAGPPPGSPTGTGPPDRGRRGQGPSEGTAPASSGAHAGSDASAGPGGSVGHQHGATLYRPGAELTRAIQARDVTCRFPGCRRAVRGCDIDHTVPHPDGPTAGCNLACLCRLHHRVKHRAGWHLEQLGDGVLRWTSPSGLVRLTRPPALGVPPSPVGRVGRVGRVEPVGSVGSVEPAGASAAAGAAEPGARSDEDDEPPWLRRAG